MEHNREHYVKISYCFYYSLFKKKSIVTTIDTTLSIVVKGTLQRKHYFSHTNTGSRLEDVTVNLRSRVTDYF